MIKVQHDSYQTIKETLSFMEKTINTYDFKSEFDKLLNYVVFQSCKNIIPL